MRKQRRFHHQQDSIQILPGAHDSEGGSWIPDPVEVQLRHGYKVVVSCAKVTLYIQLLLQFHWSTLLWWVVSFNNHKL